MDWHLPPSEAASSIIGMPSAADNQELERIGKEYMQKQRAEIADLVDAGAHDVDRDAYNAALQRVEDLRRLAVVWKAQQRREHDRDLWTNSKASSTPKSRQLVAISCPEI